MENKEGIVDKLLCMACLCVGRSLQKITDEKMKRFYLEALNEIPLCHMPSSCPNVCWECEALLNRVMAFKEQVKDSFRILQTYTKESLYECLLTEVSRPPRLQVFRNPSISIQPAGQQPCDLLSVNVKDEIKVEWVNERDNDLDLPQSDLEDPVDKSSLHYDLDLPQSNSEDPIDKSSLHYDLDLAQSDLEGSVDDSAEKDALKTEEPEKPTRKLKKLKKTDKQKTNKIKAVCLKDNIKAKKQKVQPKIITIELSYEDMLAEREREATRDSYTKAEYKCDSCLVGFNYSKSYRAHRANKHDTNLGEYSCPICKIVTSSVDSFTAHYRRHMKRYECSICHKRTQDLKVMQQHYYASHAISLKQYKCNLCGKISNSIDTHRYHKDTHKARVQCPECDKNFSHRAGLMNHRLAVHELQNAFPCTVCDKVFRWKASLKRHTEKQHAKNMAGSAAYCEACAVSFTSVCSYQRHLRNSLKHVTPEQLKFICDHCNRRFADKTKLRDHIEEKHLHKTYICHICHKPSKNRVGLDQHVRNVHRGRPNNKMCHHCGKGFPTKVQLESHIRTHTGERPFICEFCPTTFSQQSNLYKHNRQVHLNIKSKRYPLCKKSREAETKQQTAELYL